MKNTLKLLGLWWKCLVLDTKIHFARTMEQLQRYSEELNQIDHELEKMWLPKRGEIL